MENGHFEPVLEWIEDEDDGLTYDEAEELREREIEDALADCHCGSLQVVNGRVVRVADCCC